MWRGVCLQAANSGLATAIDTIDPPAEVGRPRDWSTLAMLGALWWERNPEVDDATHVLYFGIPSPEQSEQQRLAAEAEHSRAANPDTFAERCRLFFGRLERGAAKAVRACQSDAASLGRYQLGSFRPAREEPYDLSLEDPLRRCCGLATWRAP
jgi:hypothetical protein